MFFLEDPLGNFLPNLPKTRIGAKLTIPLYCLLLTAQIYFSGSHYSLLDPSIMSCKVHASWFLDSLENPVLGFICRIHGVEFWDCLEDS